MKNKETAIVINFIQTGTPLHSIYKIESLNDFIDICQDYIFNNTNETQRELMAASLNKVDWEAVAKTDRDRAKEREKERVEMPSDEIPF
jgi:hypothetical protein